MQITPAKFANTLSHDSFFQTKKIGRSIAKLASGKKINRASDDPAGLVISEKMRALVTAIEQEIENIDAQVNFYNVADGFLEQQSESLLRMRQLAIEASNTALNDSQSLAALEQAIEAERQNYNRIVDQAACGNIKLLDGSSGSVAKIEKIEKFWFGDNNAAKAIETIDNSFAQINNLRGELGAKIKNDDSSRREELLIQFRNISASLSEIADTDMAAEFIQLLSNKLALNARMAFAAQSAVSQQSASLLLGF